MASTVTSQLLADILLYTIFTTGITNISNGSWLTTARFLRSSFHKQHHWCHVDQLLQSTVQVLPKRKMKNQDITGNVHIAYRRHHYTSWDATTAAGCASSKFLPRECKSRRAGCYLYRSNSVSCPRGCYTRSDSLTDVHSLEKIEYKSSFIGNDYQKSGIFR